MLQIFNEDKDSNIVLTFAAYPRVVWDFVRQQIKTLTRYHFYFTRCIKGGVLKTKYSPSYRHCESVWFNDGRIMGEK